MGNDTLYTAKQAAAISGLGDIGLQVALDRGYFTATIVGQGRRIYRMFTRHQLVWVSAFAAMTECGIKPSVAGAYVREAQEWIEKRSLDPTFIVFDVKVASPKFLDASASLDDLREAWNWGSYVLDLHNIQKSVDFAIRPEQISVTDYVIKLAEEDQQNKARS